MIKLKEVRFQHDVFTGVQKAAVITDNPNKEFQSEIQYDPITRLCEIRIRKTGLVLLVPSDNIVNMVPEKQGEKDETIQKPTFTRTSQLAPDEPFVDDRLEKARAIADAKKPRKAK